MKKYFLLLCSILALIPVLTGCGKYDYYAHVSDERSDVFLAQTDDFTLTVSCVNREYPFLTDGVAAPKSKTVEAVLVEKEQTGAEYELYFIEDVLRGGDMSFRSVSGDYYYSRGVENFPSEAVSVRIVKNGEAEDLLATSVRTEQTLSMREALDAAVGAERETIKSMTAGNRFFGEFHVRLLRRDKNYYYVGIVNENGGTVSLLLDSETGEVLARRKTD